MTEGELPTAIASGSGAGPRDDDAIVAVDPRRVALAVGALAALVLLAALFLTALPTRVVGWLGGPHDEIERYGGVLARWQPPAGADASSLDARFARDGSAYLVPVPRVGPDDVEATAVRLVNGLEFHEVLERPEMRELVRVLALPMRHGWPLDAEIDEWHPEGSGPSHEDYFLRGETRAVIEAALAEAARHGWHLPAGMHIAYERVEPDSWQAHDGHEFWRTYVLDDAVALDGSAIANAVGTYDPNTNRPIVMLDFNRRGAQAFGELTTRIVGSRLATVLGGEVKSAPVINSAIRGGRASITMGAGSPETQERDRDTLVSVLSAGPLATGGRVLEAHYVAPVEAGVRLALARAACALVGGLAAGALAWLVVRWLRPSRRRAAVLQARDGSARLVARFAWTGLAIALYVIGARIVLPGVNALEVPRVVSHGRIAGVFDLERFSVLALGLIPAITSYVIVELVLSIVPRWRPLRDRGPLARRRIGLVVALVTLALALVQAYFVALYLESASRGGLELVVHPGLGARLTIVASLAAGAMWLVWLASIITSRGIGNGFAVLFAFGWAVHVVTYVGELSPAALVLALAALAALVVIVVATSRWRVRGLRSVAIPIPASGIAPLSDAGGLLPLIGLLSGLGVVGDWLMAVVDRVQPLRYELGAAIVVVVMTVVWSYAFARPGRRARELERVGLTAATREMWLRATVLSLLVLLAIRAIARAAAHVDAPLAAIIDPVATVTAIAAVVDLLDEVRARRRALVPVWPLHDPLLVDVVRDRLAASGISHHVQATRLRTLLWVFGSYVPMNVLVPPDRADEATRVMRELFV